VIPLPCASSPNFIFTSLLHLLELCASMMLIFWFSQSLPSWCSSTRLGTFVSTKQTTRAYHTYSRYQWYHCLCLQSQLHFTFLLHLEPCASWIMLIFWFSQLLPSWRSSTRLGTLYQQKKQQCIYIQLPCTSSPNLIFTFLLYLEPRVSLYHISNESMMLIFWSYSPNKHHWFIQNRVERGAWF